MRFLTKSKNESYVMDLAQDITGLSVTYRLVDNGTTVFQKSILNGITVLNEAIGRIKLEILSDDTYDLVHRDFVGEVYVNENLEVTESVRFFPFNGTTTAYLASGATASRPTLPTDRYIGFEYFDITINRSIVWNGTSWVDTSGVNEADIATLESDVTILDGRVDIAESDIITLESGVTTLDSRVSDTEADLENTYTS